ncbi:uncharacterized protein LOC112091535 [Morus notabilis]|uniref:uncharacterized protein LOC112091535 n=1 Tax=Morus notabilis TaxID=981085 RepID=UPI000CED09EE|nr:uncharacterized protein LOC112091535 [Morus notabilis]
MAPKNTRSTTANQKDKAPATAGTSTTPPLPSARNPPDRIDQLQKQVETLAAAVERMATTFAGRDQRQNSMPPLEDAPMNPTLSRVYQGPNESLKDWIARFGEQVAATEGISDEVALMGALSSMKKDIPYSTDLDQRPPHTYQEFLTRAQGFINAEEAKKALKSKAATPVKEEAGQANNQKNGKKHRGHPQVQAKQRYKPAPSSRGGNASTSQGENKRPKPQRYDAYTPLTMGIEDVYHEISHLQVLRRPPPLKSDPARRNQHKYCQFHGESGHTTAECYDLRDEVERLIRESEYRAGCRNNNNRRNNDRREEQRHDNLPELIGVIRTIFGGPYFGGTSHRAQKDYAREAKEKFRRRVMNVSGREAKTAQYEDNDNDSSVDILYSDFLDKMGIPRARLQNRAQPLYGFTGDSVIPKGAIELPMTIGD